MEKTANNETKKCSNYQGNAIDCQSYTKEKGTLNRNNCSDEVRANAISQQSETNKFIKWKEKLSRFCQNKSEKITVEQEEKEVAKEKPVEVSPPKTSENYSLLKELLPEIKDFNKISASNLNREIIEQRLRTLKKSYTLPLHLNAVQRNQKNLLANKMEILTENEQNHKEILPLALGNIPIDTKSKAKQLQDKPKDTTHEDVLPHVTVTNKKASSPRCMISVCPNHDGRHGGEALEAALYCAACLQTVCYKCAFEKHKDHKITPIQAAAENIRISLAERKRKIENAISQMRTKRKSIETNNEEVQQQIHTQFEQVVERLKKKEGEVMEEVGKLTQRRVNLILGIQNQQETAWGQIDAVLKTQDDAKMLEEYNGLSVIEFNIPDNLACSSFSPLENGGHCLKRESPRAAVDLNRLQDEIEKICLAGSELESNLDGYHESISNGRTPRQSNKRFNFKLDMSTAHTALRVAANQSSVEYVGSERNGVNTKHINAAVSSLSTGHPYNSKYPRIPNGLTGKLKRTQFATVLGDSSITQVYKAFENILFEQLFIGFLKSPQLDVGIQTSLTVTLISGKQYWEVSVNRSMEYRLGVAYKHMQGTKTLADEHNCWALCLTYPDRFAAIHKHHKDYIFIPTHTAVQTSKVIRIGIFLDYERGVLSFYNASMAAEKKHLYTFRTFFNRPVWPLLSLRQGSWFDSHPSYVVASLDKMLHDDYHCLVNSDKQQIKDIRKENLGNLSTPKRVSIGPLHSVSVVFS